MRILVTGGKGQLGLALRSLENNFSEFTFFFPDKNNLNIIDSNAVENYVLENKISSIINCAAYTNVDKAEDEPDLANKINYLAVENLAKISKKYRLKLIHISTDYVFDGNSKIPYLEGDETSPQNVYGATKLRGEKVLLEINPSNSMLIRTSWLYSSFGSNFVKTILRLTKEKDKIQVVSNQIGSPTYAIDLARTILLILPIVKSKGVQLVHYANKGACSWYQFAEEIISLSKSQCSVTPIEASKFESKAKRPNFSLLNTEKIQNTFDIEIPFWKDSLKVCISKLL